MQAKIGDAPWNIAIEVIHEGGGLCTGTIVSSRHVLTARHCFALFTENGYVWTSGNEKIDGCQNENENDLVLNGNFSNMFKVYAGTDCGFRRNCPGSKYTSIEISKVPFLDYFSFDTSFQIILPKVCDDKQLEFDDFAILELSENLNFSKRIQAICVTHDDKYTFENDVQMKLFGYGVDPASGENSAGRLRSETVKAEKCFKTTEKSFCTKSLSKNQLACMGDSGGGVVRMIDDRVTVVGVIYQGVTCEIATINEKDYVSSVAFYSNDICKYTGICSK
ncbi:hypothetical protein GCK72_002294 [Caenorhabditis remanei]|uniref:Peptidase S1 domain-containing protein n=1 Tax=Caenorhabditis remanei TaxID=31234 RepID=A0A6A5HSC4_CAERE|nr:hypothetical protein GCK72_002294 [Caenorhabditis remanei]KAF1770475.1 hypothetical protein GCK72_002294 [Caenorhabditis remanei]